MINTILTPFFAFIISATVTMLFTGLIIEGLKEHKEELQGYIKNREYRQIPAFIIQTIATLLLTGLSIYMTYFIVMVSCLVVFPASSENTVLPVFVVLCVISALTYKRIMEYSELHTKTTVFAFLMLFVSLGLYNEYDKRHNPDRIAFSECKEKHGEAACFEELLQKEGIRR